MSVEQAASSFPARVAALVSPGAELISRKNNLSFADLLQPFCRISAEGIWTLDILPVYLSNYTFHFITLRLIYTNRFDQLSIMTTRSEWTND